MKHDYLIIGQGLAGSILAYQLLSRGKSVAIIDERNPSSSSRVAAGLANPFTGPKMVKSWKAEDLFPFLKQFYHALETETNAHFFSERTIYRPFGSIEELNDWYGRSTQPNYQKFIRSICEKGKHSDVVNEQYGGVEITGYMLNVPAFLDALYLYFQTKCTFVEGRFDESKVRIHDDGFSYRNIDAGKIIYCTGYQIHHSKYFGWIPLAPVKGEILHLKMNTDFETIYNQSCFIIPQGNGMFKAGSTYNRMDLTNQPTEQGKNEITKRLDALLKMEYKMRK